MITYSIIMFLTSILFGMLGVAIYLGKTNLIHDYHQTNVTDKAAYGKSFGKDYIGCGCSIDCWINNRIYLHFLRAEKI